MSASASFTADFVKNLRQHMGGDERVPDLKIHSFSYMYLADSEALASILRSNQQVQLTAGAATQLMTAAQISEAYPFYKVDDIVLGSINLVDEGYWDGATVFDWFRRQARERGVEYVENEVVAITRNADGNRVGKRYAQIGRGDCPGQLVNASGPRAARTARMAGIDIRSNPASALPGFSGQAARPGFAADDRPSGVHVREIGGGTYQAGGDISPDFDPPVDPEDFDMDHSLWENHIWPAINCIPQFEAIKVTSEWAGSLFDEHAGSECDCRSASRNCEFPVYQWFFRPWLAAIARHGTWNSGMACSWGISKPRPLTLPF
ncbi:MAG: FAD-dependent oxidoreductase [Nitratireductor sp.]